MRFVVRALYVGDWDFGDSCAMRAGERRNEAVHVAAETNALDDWRTVRLEGRSEIVQRNAGELRDQPVRDLRRQSSGPVVVDAPLAPAADDIVPVVESGEEERQIFRGML